VLGEARSWDMFGCACVALAEFCRSGSCRAAGAQWAEDKQGGGDMAGNAGSAGLEGLAGRYARALYDLAREEGRVDETAGELAGIVSLLDKSHELDLVLKSPLFSARQKMAALGEVLKRAGFRGLIVRFISIAARNNRLPVLREMARAFEDLRARDRGEIEALVISAQGLSSGQLERIRKNLGEAAGRKVRLVERHDPEILGGLIIKSGSRMIDTSMRTHLEKLRARMKEAG